MKLQVQVIGSGASLGVPVIGCGCKTCISQNPRNKRLRSSLYLQVNGKNLLIDAGPDFRAQALQYGITHLDGVIFTHAHQDHIAGIDDLKIYYFRNSAPLPCLVSQATAKELKMRFHFMFTLQPQEVPGLERLKLDILEGFSGDVDFLGVPIHYFSYEQIGMPVLGIRIGNFAYITDIKKFDKNIFTHLKGIDTLILSALRFTSSHMHLTVDEAIDFVNEVNPRQTFLTHTSHDLEYEKTNAYLPSSIRLAYDGLKISI